MKNLWTNKGCFGYIKNRRLWSIIKTILFFGISISLYIAGIKATGSNKNLLTIVAVLGCLPASKSAVNMIMYLRYKGCSQEVFDAVNKEYKQLHALCDLVFTSYDKTFEIHHMGITDKVVCGYTSNPKCDAAACEKHLQGMLTQNGLKDITVKIFKDLPKYRNRLEQLETLSDFGAVADDIRQLMFEISL